MIDISTLSTAFANELNGGLYLNKVKQGTLAELVTPMQGILGLQDLNTMDFDLTWETNARTGILDDGTSVFDVANSDIDFGKRTMDIRPEYAKGRVNPHQIETVYLRNAPGFGNVYDPTTEIVGQGVEQLIQQGNKRISTNFYTGFGGSTSNGFNGITGKTAVDTLAAAFSATTALAKMAVLHSSVAASEIAGEDDINFVLSASDYLAYRQGLRLEGLNDVLQSQVTEGGLTQSPWIDDPRITVIGDSAYTGEPFVTNLSNMVFGSYQSNLIEGADVYWDKTKRAITFEVFLYGGVQIFEPANVFVNNDA